MNLKPRAKMTGRLLPGERKARRRQLKTHPSMLRMTRLQLRYSNLIMSKMILGAAAAGTSGTSVKRRKVRRAQYSTLHLLHFERLPGAKLTSIDIAINKAFTAAGHKAPTSVYKENVWPGGKAFGLNNSNGGKFMYVAGGIPLVVEGVVVGAVGCSTGTPDQDLEVARAGVEAFERAWEGQQGQLKAKL